VLVGEIRDGLFIDRFGLRDQIHQEGLEIRAGSRRPALQFGSLMRQQCESEIHLQPDLSLWNPRIWWEGKGLRDAPPAANRILFLLHGFPRLKILSRCQAFLDQDGLDETSSHRFTNFRVSRVAVAIPRLAIYDTG
jgi:hypothetical protein